MYHLVTINCRYTHSCLALFYLRQALHRHLPGCKTVISQFTLNDPYYKTLLALTRRDCQALFFSVYIWNHEYIQRLIADVATIRPNLPLVLGGPQAPRLTDLPSRATVVKGEIEGLASTFYQDLRTGTLLPVYTAQARPSFSSPYRGDDFNTALRNRQVYYESSRGCPFHCSYCLSSTSHGVRHLDLDQVRQELEVILQAEPTIVRFVDRTFNVDQDRTLALWRFLAHKSTRTRFHFEIAPDRFSDEMLALLETVPPGRFQFEVGFQSFTPEVLAAVERQTDLEAATRHVRCLVAQDRIHIHADLILGLPFETRESFQYSFNHLFALAPHHMQLGLLKVLPGTRLAARCKSFGLVHCTRPPYEILSTRWLNHDTLRSLHAFCDCVEAFYNNRFFPTIWHYLRQKGEDAFLFFTTLLELAQREEFFARAPTHTFLNQLLVKLSTIRPDGEVLLDLLRYDWLRCGYRFLPPELDTGELKAMRHQARLQLPQNLEGLYSYQDREEFFKQGIFLPLGRAAMQLLDPGWKNQEAIVCFLPGQTGGVRNYQETVVFGRLPTGGLTTDRIISRRDG